MSKMSTSCTVEAYEPNNNPLVSIDKFRDEASFAEMQQKLAADVVSDPHLGSTSYWLCARRIKDVDASDAAARLGAATACFYITPQPWVTKTVKGEHALAIATTVRLRSPELMEVAKSWLAAVPDVDRAGEWVPTVVGAALEKNLHRTKWDNRKLAELLPMVMKITEDEDTHESQAVDAVISWLPSERQQVLASLVRPMNEPENARFWFDMLFCRFDDETPTFNFRDDHGEDTIKTFCEAIDARVLAKVIEITVEEEENEAEFWDNDQNRYDEYPALTAAETHELTIQLLEAWVAARNFPADLRSPEEQTAFIGTLTSLPLGIKHFISHEALKWVLGCSQLQDHVMAQRICSALA